MRIQGPWDSYKISPYKKCEVNKKWDGIHFKTFSSSYNPLQFIEGNNKLLNPYGFKEHSGVKVCDFSIIDRRRERCVNDEGEIIIKDEPISFSCTYFRMDDCELKFGLFKMMRELQVNNEEYNTWETWVEHNEHVKGEYSLLPSHSMLDEVGLVLMIHNFSPEYHKKIDIRSIVLAMILDEVDYERYEVDAKIADCSVGISNKLTVIKSKDVDLDMCLRKINNELLYSQRRETAKSVLDDSKDFFVFPTFIQVNSVPIKVETPEAKVGQKSMLDDGGFIEIALDPQEDDDHRSDLKIDTVYEDCYYWD